jgi:hypothetical protein
MRIVEEITIKFFCFAITLPQRNNYGKMNFGTLDEHVQKAMIFSRETKVLLPEIQLHTRIGRSLNCGAPLLTPTTVFIR